MNTYFHCVRLCVCPSCVQMPDSCQMWLWQESAPGSVMSSATLTPAGCPWATRPASATAATPLGSPPSPPETTTTTCVATTTRATARAPAARGAQSPGWWWWWAETVRGFPWPMGIPSAPSGAETATGTWATTTATFWTARWPLRPTIRSAARASGGDSRTRKGERARTRPRSYRWRAREGTTRPRPASRCHAERSTCDGWSHRSLVWKAQPNGEGYDFHIISSEDLFNPQRCFPKAVYQIGFLDSDFYL